MRSQSYTNEILCTAAASIAFDPIACLRPAAVPTPTCTPKKHTLQKVLYLFEEMFLDSPLRAGFTRR
jgi:hypothetical protein